MLVLKIIFKDKLNVKGVIYDLSWIIYELCRIFRKRYISNRIVKIVGNIEMGK